MRRFVGIASALLAGLLPVLQLHAFVPREAVSRQPSAVSVEQAFSLKVTTERRDAPGNFSAPSACSAFEPHSHASQLPHFHTDALTHFSPDATNTYHAVRDHLGSVCVLVDSTGATKEQYRYGAWGETQILNASGQPVPASSCGSRFLFHGGEYSEATGLYRFRARWYAPELGRWLSPDPIGLEGGLNLYEFCGNNPVNYIDPYGLDSMWGAAWGGFADNLRQDGLYNAAQGAYGFVRSPLDFVTGLYALGGAAGDFIGRMWADRSCTWDDTLDRLSNLDPWAMLDNWMNDPQAIGSTFGQAALGIGARRMMAGAGATKNRLGGNPFKGKTPQQIDEMFKAKGFTPKGPDPMFGKGSYINPQTGRKYYIDPGETYKKGVELPHVDIHRPPTSTLPKKKLPLGDSLYE